MTPTPMQRRDPRDTVIARLRWELSGVGWVRVIALRGQDITYQQLNDGPVTTVALQEFLAGARDPNGNDPWGRYRAPWSPEPVVEKVAWWSEGSGAARRVWRGARVWLGARWHRLRANSLALGNALGGWRVPGFGRLFPGQVWRLPEVGAVELLDVEAQRVFYRKLRGNDRFGCGRREFVLAARDARGCDVFGVRHASSEVVDYPGATGRRPGGP